MSLKRRVKKGKVVHLLQLTYIVAYHRFLKEHPNTKLRYVKFIESKPKNVRHMKALERIVCVCKTCENIRLKCQDLNHLVVKENKKELKVDHISDPTVISKYNNV